MRSKKITINIQEPYFKYLINGQKKIEGRLKTLYNNFNQMIKTEGVKNVIPDKVSIQDAVHVYYKFYTKTEEKKFGVIALEVKKL